MLFTDLKGSTDLYDRIGDLNALSLVQQHFERLRDVTVRHGGAIIKTIGDAVMAAFVEPADAVRAALAMLQDMERSMAACRAGRSFSRSAFTEGRPSLSHSMSASTTSAKRSTSQPAFRAYRTQGRSV
ncbi:MAG: adenylate/guanylate cyclase domain-containing protein [Microvirga sp.]